jgi:tRNA 2-thiouridine synthesizing protein A
MASEIATVVDARGLICPMPTIRLGQAIRKVNVGDVVEMWTDDPGSQLNMDAWTKNTGHELLNSSVDDNVFKYQVRRGRRRPRLTISGNRPCMRTMTTRNRDVSPLSLQRERSIWHTLP